MIRKKQNKDKTTKFEASVIVGGKRIYQRFDSYKEAENWINTARYKRCNGTPMHFGKVTVDMLFESYLQSAENKGNAPTAIYKAEINFKKHIKPFYQEHDMRTVSIEEHEALLSNLRKSGLKPSTCNRVRSLLCAMYNVAIRKRRFGGAITFNPFTCIEPRKEIQGAVKYWDIPSINRFLESERGSHYYPLWIFLLNTGLRIGETVALHREQIDLSTNTVTIDRIWCLTTNAIRRETKGGRIRHVGLNGITQEVLYPFLKEGLVFIKPDGTQLTTDYMIKFVLPKACKKAGVPNIGCHGFRHSFSAHYLMNSGSIWDLQKILGHSTVKTTEERYAHFSREHIQKRASVVSIGESNVLKVDFPRKSGVPVA